MSDDLLQKTLSKCSRVDVFAFSKIYFHYVFEAAKWASMNEYPQTKQASPNRSINQRDEISSVCDKNNESAFKMQMMLRLLATLRRNSLGFASRPQRVSIRMMTLVRLHQHHRVQMFDAETTNFLPIQLWIFL